MEPAGQLTAPMIVPTDWSGVSFACPDWVDRLRNGRSLVPSLPLDPDEAQRAVDIFNNLCLPDVPLKADGSRLSLKEGAGEWLRDICRSVFGSVDAQGVRHVPEVFGLAPKKNSKTTGGAAIMVTALLMNRRPRAEFILVGPTQEVADLAFQQASGMIDADPAGYLQKRFLVQEHIKTIFDRRTKARLKIKTFDLKVMTGSKPAGVLLDELHLMSSMSYATRVVGQIRGGLLANPEAFLIIITTQSDTPPAGVFKSELEYARGVRDGRITEEVRMLPMLYEFPLAMQVSDKPGQEAWRDPAIWPWVLPNLGKPVTVARLMTDWATAQEKGKEEEQRWASQHLNIEIGLSRSATGWNGAAYWAKQANTEITLEAIKARCDVAVVGIDGGGLDDLLGLTVIGRDRETREWLWWSKAWAQTDALEERQSIVERLTDFQNQGDLVICEHPTQDVEEVADVVQGLFLARLLPEKNAIGFDPQGVAAMIEELASRGIPDEMIVGVPQGYRLSGAIWGAERKLKDGTLWHSGSAMLAWCVGNAKAEKRGNAVLITKQAAGTAKIDPLIAGFNAVQLMTRNPEPPPPPPKHQLIVVG